MRRHREDIDQNSDQNGDQNGDQNSEKDGARTGKGHGVDGEPPELEAEELTVDQRRRLSVQLSDLQVELERHISVGGESAKTVDLDAPIGRLTRVDAMQRQQIAAETLRRQSVRLAQVRAALTRLTRDDDLFGLCTRCEEPIGWRRLSARPEAPICMACQRQQEARR